MAWIYFVSLYLIIITFLSIFLTVEIITLNGSVYARSLKLLSVAVCFYIFGYVLELNSVNEEQMQFWNIIQYIGIPYVSALWLSIAIKYIGYPVKYKKILVAVIYTIPVISMLLRFTNQYHHLYFKSIRFVEAYGNLFLVKQYGFLMYLQTFHSMIMIIIAMSLFLREALKKQEKHIGQIILTSIASSLAVLGLVFSVLRPYKLLIDYMAMTLPLVSLCVICAMSKYELLEIKSIARNKVFELGTDAIILINTNNRIIDYNLSAKQLFEHINVKPDDRYLHKVFAGDTVFLDGILNSKPNVVSVTAGGEKQYYNIITNNIGDSNLIHGWIKTIQNVTLVYRLNEELQKLAMTDELSGLNNRRAFYKFANEWIDKSDLNSSEFYLIMIDFDYFKQINDNYGHLAGDMVIREFGSVLKNFFTDNSIIARLGGEEFSVLFKSENDENAFSTANIFLKIAGEHIYRYNSNEFHVTVSIGLAKMQPDHTLETLMYGADNALYRSKKCGRNQCNLY